MGHCKVHFMMELAMALDEIKLKYEIESRVMVIGGMYLFSTYAPMTYLSIQRCTFISSIK